jgi:UDP-glucose 4-epimerase
MLVYSRRNEEAFDVFNVATDDYITVTEIAKIACEVAKINPENVKFNYTGGDRGWKGDVPKVLFDVAKIKAQGWSAKYTSAQAIHSSIESMNREINTTC